MNVVTRLCKYVSRYFWNLQTCLKHWYFIMSDDVTGMACDFQGPCGRYEGNLLAHDMIYLTAIGLTPSGSSTVHIYTQTIHEQHNGHKTIHRTTQYMEQHN